MMAVFTPAKTRNLLRTFNLTYKHGSFVRYLLDCIVSVMMSIMTLNQPPLWEYLLLEEPFDLVLALGLPMVLILLLAIYWRRKNPALVAAAGLAVAMGVYLLAAVVVTDREQLLDQTKTLIAATKPLNWPVIDGMVSPQVIITKSDGQSWMSRQQMQVSLQNYDVVGHDIVAIDAGITESGTGISMCELHSRFKIEPRAVCVSSWQLTWRKLHDASWEVVEIQCLKVQGVQAM